MALTQTQVSQLYVSVFGRASEGEGNTYWQTDQADMVSTANTMLETPAAIDYFGTTLNDNSAFIEHIYENTLGKTIEDDAEGIAYWVTELEAGKSKGEVVAALITSAQASANAGDAQDQFNNKVAVSNYTADTIEEFTNTTDFTNFIKDVDSTEESVTSSKAVVLAAVPDGTETDADDIQGSTFQLTDGDVGTGAADNILGTEGNDQIAGATGTLESIDVVNGAGGTDVLTARMDSNLGVTVAPVVSNVETIDIITRGNGTLSFADITGFTDVSLSGTTGYTLADLPNNFDVTLRDLDGEGMTFDLDTASGAADAIFVTLDGTSGATSFTNTQDLEAINIKSTGDAGNKIALNATGFDVLNGAITVTGDQALTLVLPNDGGNAANDDYSGVVLDASGFDAALTIANTDTDTLNAKNFTGVDVYAFSASATSWSVENTEAGAVLAGSLKTGSNTLTVDYDLADAEKISSKTDALDVSVKMNDSSGEDDFVVNLTTNEIETVSVSATGAASADSTLTLNFADTDIQTLSVAGESLAVIDSLTVGGAGLAASNLTNFSASDATADVDITVTAAAGITTGDTIEFAMGSGDDTVNYNGNASAVVEAGAGDDSVTIAGSGNSEIEGGAGDDTITAGSGNDDIEGGAGDDSINGGAGADKIDGGAGDDTLTAGAGADIITGGAGDDTITLGAGVDTVVYNAQSEVGTGGDVVTGWAATDLLNFDNAAFGNLGAGAIGTTVAVATALAANTSAQFIFTGGSVLKFDADGTGTNASLITIATFNAAVTQNQIVIV